MEMLLKLAKSPARAAIVSLIRSSFSGLVIPMPENMPPIVPTYCFACNWVRPKAASARFAQSFIRSFPSAPNTVLVTLSTSMRLEA